ncbi:MAG: SO_0444 family Cu/Zn efflux transporter [Acidobacteriota bacterium]
MTVFLQQLATETVRMLYLAAPFLLLGLVMAGFIHVLLPSRWIERWMGSRGLGGATLAALVGVPLPVCSCGVVPIAIEMRRKKASDPASLSFLVTTPESGVDSILFTWALMGPVMAIARPIAAFFTALFGAVLAIAYLPPRIDDGAADLPEDTGCDHHSHGHHDHGHHDHDHDGHDHGHDHSHGHHGHDHSHDLTYSKADEALAALAAGWRRLRRFGRRAEGEPSPDIWRKVVKPAFRYGFGELFDDIAFWLGAGLVLAGLLSVILPSDLADRGLGQGLVPMLVMLAVGIPLYMCASASTPIAAALLMKGLSPGAALVFLLAGPATNAASLVVLTRTFGRRFIQIYLLSVILASLICGLALDAFVVALGLEMAVPLVAAEEMTYGWVGIASFVLLVLLLLRAGLRGALRSGWNEAVDGFRALAATAASRGLRLGRRSATVAALALALAAWLAAGLVTIPADSQGFVLTFGAASGEPLGPGLHWTPPPPISRVEVRRVGYPRKADVGFRTDLQTLSQRQLLTRFANPADWHSPVAAMNPDPERATFLTADENLLEMSFSVHYRPKDPRAFFFRFDHGRDFIALYAEAAARRLMASKTLDEVLTSGRRDVEAWIQGAAQTHLDGLGAGVDVVTVRVVDVHPPGQSVYWFRDVSSAWEDMETTIHHAEKQRAEELPRARGRARLIEAQARAEAASRGAEAKGTLQGFAARADAVATAPGILEHLLWIESVERALSGKRKYVIPGDAAQDVTLWHGASRAEDEAPEPGGHRP